MTTHLNPDPNLHIDLLRGQLAIGELLLARFNREDRQEEAADINMELQKLQRIIYEKL